jgi:hypothetical protein
MCLVRCTRFLTNIVRRTKAASWSEISDTNDSHLGKDATVVKIEEMQQYGKEQFETAVASAASLQQGVQAIATVVGDYTKKSFEESNAFVGKLAGVKSLEKAMEVQTEYAKSAYESFIAESQKIGSMYTDLAKQAYKPFEGMVAKMTPAR